jgi:hypothetical protein
VAITTVNVSSPAVETIFTDTAMGNVADGVKASSAKVYSVTIDNTANAGAACYVKLYNVASGSVVTGTTVPDEVIFVPQGIIKTVTYFTGATPGVTYPTALSAICVTAGGTAGAVAPSSSVVVSINYV